VLTRWPANKSVSVPGQKNGPHKKYKSVFCMGGLGGVSARVRDGSLEGREGNTGGPVCYKMTFFRPFITKSVCWSGAGKAPEEWSLLERLYQ
jgi:hypothetical protein